MLLAPGLKISHSVRQRRAADLLFLEACQQRGVRCQILLPFPEPEFIERSILPSAQRRHVA